MLPTMDNFIKNMLLLRVCMSVKLVIEMGKCFSQTFVVIKVSANPQKCNKRGASKIFIHRLFGTANMGG